MFTDSEERKKLIFEHDPNASRILNETFVDRSTPVENVWNFLISSGSIIIDIII